MENDEVLKKTRPPVFRKWGAGRKVDQRKFDGRSYADYEAKN